MKENLITLLYLAVFHSLFFLGLYLIHLIRKKPDEEEKPFDPEANKEPQRKERERQIIEKFGKQYLN